MKKIIRVLFILIVIFSLSLNVLLLYNMKNNNNKETKDNKIVDDNKVQEINYNKETISKLFMNYQYDAKLADSEKIAIFEVEKVTYVGYFKSNKAKKLYYIDEKYSCIEGTDCVSASSKVDIDKDNNNRTTFVVAVTPISEEDAEFEILDYKIEDTKDFQKENHKEIK